jgi:acetolactate synthase I/II/III large subunit
MADGWARVTGKTAVCSVTNGPGIAQLATSLVVASRAHTPIVIFTGDVAEGEVHPQQLDHRRFAEATEAGYVRVSEPAGMHEGVRKAFFLARLEARPVILDVPRDIQLMEFEDEPYASSTTLLPQAQRICPDRARLEQALQIISQSRKPVIIVGRGAMESGAGEVVLRFAERIGALIATTLLAKGWLAGAEFYAGISGLFTPRATLEVLSEADCVVGVGASLNDYTIESGYLYGNAQFIHIDTEPAIIMGSGKRAECYLQGDARTTLEALEAMLAERKLQATGFRTSEVRQALAAEVDPASFEIEAGTVDPREACVLLDEAMPEEMGLVLGLGHFIAFPAMLMTRRRAITLATVQFSCIGQGLTTALGAAVALKKPTVLVEGDASMMMQLQELDTAARYGIPLLMVVMNDEASGAEYHKLRAHGLDPMLAAVRSPDLGAVARTLGCRGSLVRTLDDFRSAVEEFIKKPGPTVIDLRVSRNVPSVPYRRLHFGEVA